MHTAPGYKMRFALWDAQRRDFTSADAWVMLSKFRFHDYSLLFLAIRHSHFSRSNVLFRMRLLLTPGTRMMDESERERKTPACTWDYCYKAGCLKVKPMIARSYDKQENWYYKIEKKRIVWFFMVRAIERQINHFIELYIVMAWNFATCVFV